MQLSRITQSFSRRAWSPVAQLARLTSQVSRQHSKAVAAVVLAAVFMLYTQPEFMVRMADHVWACF